MTLLPRRDPGSSGIAGVSPESAFDEPGAPAAPDESWWSQDESGHEEPEPALPADTSGFFSSRERLRDVGVPESPPPVPAPEQAEEAVDSSMVIHYQSDPEDAAVQIISDESGAPDTGSIDLSDMNRLAEEIAPQVARSGVDLIYQNMVNEWLVDPDEIDAEPQDWKSVWDNGWAAAEDGREQTRRSPHRAGPAGARPRRPAHPRSEQPTSQLALVRAADEQNGVASSGGVHPGRDARET